MTPSKTVQLLLCGFIRRIVRSVVGCVQSELQLHHWGRANKLNTWKHRSAIVYLRKYNKLVPRVTFSVSLPGGTSCGDRGFGSPPRPKRRNSSGVRKIQWSPDPRLCRSIWFAGVNSTSSSNKNATTQRRCLALGVHSFHHRAPSHFGKAFGAAVLRGGRRLDLFSSQSASASTAAASSAAQHPVSLVPRKRGGPLS